MQQNKNKKQKQNETAIMGKRQIKQAVRGKKKKIEAWLKKSLCDWKSQHSLVGSNYHEIDVCQALQRARNVSCLLFLENNYVNFVVKYISSP